MNDKVIVNAEGLQQVSKELAANSEKMYALYSKDIVSVLNSCQEELKVSGLDTNIVSESFQKMFSDLRTKTEELIGALDNTIIPEYEASAQTINHLFNNEFANKINEYLEIMKKD